jgi:hypothetical protein
MQRVCHLVGPRSRFASQFLVRTTCSPLLFYFCSVSGSGVWRCGKRLLGRLLVLEVEGETTFEPYSDIFVLIHSMNVIFIAVTLLPSGRKYLRLRFIRSKPRLPSDRALIEQNSPT